MADRVGRRAMMIGSALISAPLLGLLLLAMNAQAPLLAICALVAALGFTLVASQTAFVVLGQEFLPNRIGIASGVTLGLAISLGGAFSPVLGAIADRFGIGATLEAIIGLLLLAVVAGCTLPRRPRGVPAHAATERPTEIAELEPAPA
jgi:FSR family fosmidomycin resistance protein-like MFS transporter